MAARRQTERHLSLITTAQYDPTHRSWACRGCLCVFVFIMLWLFIGANLVEHPVEPSSILACNNRTYPSKSGYVIASAPIEAAYDVNVRTWNGRGIKEAQRAVIKHAQ